MTKPTLCVFSRSSRWLATVRSAAGDEFVVQVSEHLPSDPQGLAELQRPSGRALMLIDSTLAPDVGTTIPALREAGWEYVVVVAANPSWKQARAVLRDAGGFDYWPKTYDPKILRADLRRCWQEITAAGD